MTAWPTAPRTSSSPRSASTGTTMPAGSPVSPVPRKAQPTAVPTYIYVTYIRAGVEQVWQALTDADLTSITGWHRDKSAEAPIVLSPAGLRRSVRLTPSIEPPAGLVQYSSMMTRGLV